MMLSELARALGAHSTTGDRDAPVTAVEYDSRRVGPGAIFVAVRGHQVDGRRFIPQAVKAGAAAVLTDAPLETDPGVPVLTLPDVRSGMALAAAVLYGRPTEGLLMIGLTGTNGKTTTAFLLESILEADGRKTGVLGTVNFRYAGRVRPAPNTTPEGPDLQKMLAEMRDSGVSAAVMEVSSHALDLGRVAGCAFDAAVFTNLSQDHLDYHGDLDCYFEAKAKLYSDYLRGKKLAQGPAAVINIDDSWGRKLAERHAGRTVTFGLDPDADVRALDHCSERTGLTARIDTPAGAFDLRSPLIGDFNLYNVLAATAAAHAVGLPLEAVSRGLSASHGAPGRLERVGQNDDYLVLVDYAHTPDALDRALSAIRALAPRRLVTVFGCGGDRDRTKRPLMGRAAGRLSDLAVVTSDNPRTEEPLAIIEEILPGLARPELRRIDAESIDGGYEPGGYVVAPDRREAIRLACRVLGPGDALVIAGKGHEDYQILGREKIHFDDREEALLALSEEGKS